MARILEFITRLIYGRANKTLDLEILDDERQVQLERIADETLADLEYQRWRDHLIYREEDLDEHDWWDRRY